MQSESHTQNPVVDLRSVTKRYGHVVAVDNVSLTVSEGEFITLWGRAVPARRRCYG
jgi:ABC-type Fe3+/spermidine/putrescine transport system ATPase subunit